ncbi:hypothetical protein YPPY07_2281, partial [Yersinia pestis PY-07]
MILTNKNAATIPGINIGARSTAIIPSLAISGFF